MADSVDYGRGSGGRSAFEVIAELGKDSSAYQDLTRRAEEASEAQTKSTGALRENIGARTNVTEATSRLSSELARSIDLLNSETKAIEANTVALRANALAAAEAISGAGVTRGPRAPRTAAPVAESTAAAATATSVSVDLAAAQRTAAIFEKANADKTAATTAKTYRSATSAASAATPEERAAALEQAEAARQQAAAAKATLTAANQQLAASRAAEAAAEAQTRAYQVQAAQASVAEAERQARLPVPVAGPAYGPSFAADPARLAAYGSTGVFSERLALPPGRIPPGTGDLAGYGREQLLLNPGREYPALPYRASGGEPIIGYPPPPPAGDPFIAGPAGADATRRASEQRLLGAGPVRGFTADQESLYAKNAAGLEQLGARQLAVNGAFQESVAAYGASSQALRRHGALTAEFVQAFARGEVTLQEFQSQMLTTIGKFAGWAVAGAAVYGAYDALKQLADGAKEAQNGYIQLTRFIPNISQSTATNLFTGISTQLNVPIKDVVDTSTILARRFKTVPELRDATTASILASKLDDIAPTAGATDFIGISAAYGDKGKPLDVINSLNALQRQYGARVAQTLPGLARAAPAAAAAGLDQNTLEALIGLGVRSGLSGSQVATAISRSATTFVERPQNQELLRSYGFDPTQSYGSLINSISAFVRSQNEQGKTVSGKELRDLAVGLAGPQLGARSFAPIIARIADLPKFEATARDPGETALQERQKQLGSVSEEFKTIGITLQNVGARFSESGILIPLQALLAVFDQLGHAAEFLAGPFEVMGAALGGLPGILKEIVGAAVLLAASQAVYRSTFGRTATGALSQVRGFSFLDSPSQQAVRQLQATGKTGLGIAQNEQEAATREWVAASRNAQKANAEVGRLGTADTYTMTDPQRQAHEEEVAKALSEQAVAIKKVTQAEERYWAAVNEATEWIAQNRLLASREFSAAQKVASSAERGFYGTPAGAPTVTPPQAPFREDPSVFEANRRLTPAERTEQLKQQVREGNYTQQPSGLIIPGSAKGAVTGALSGVPDEAIAATALRTVASENPGFIAARFNSIGARLSAGDSTLAAVGAGLFGGLGRSGAVGRADTFAGGAFGGARSLGGGLVGAVPGAIGATFQGLIAAQLVNLIAPGAVGNTLSKYITAGSIGLGGAVLASGALGRVGLGGISGATGFGLAAGLAATQSNNPLVSAAGVAGAGYFAGRAATGVLAGALPEGADLLGLAAPELALPVAATALAGYGVSKLLGGGAAGVLGATGAGAAFGAGLGLLGGPFAPLTSTAGAIIGGGVGLVTGLASDLLGGGGESADQKQKDAVYKAEQEQANQLKHANFNAPGVASSFGDQFAAQVEDTFKSTGNDFQKNLSALNARITVLVDNVTAYGLTSPQGSNAAAALEAAGPRIIEQAAIYGKNIDQAIQAAQKIDQGLAQAFQQEFAQALALASGPGDRSAALGAFAASQGAQLQGYVTQTETDQNKLADQNAKYNQIYDQIVKGKASGQNVSGLQKQLAGVGGNISGTRDEITGLQSRQIALRRTNQVAYQQAQQQIFSANQTDIGAAGTIAQARAGSDQLKQLQTQLATSHAELANAVDNLSASPAQQADQIDQIKAKVIQINQQIVQETLNRIQSLQQLQEALVPLNIPGALQAKQVSDAQSTAAFENAHPRDFSIEQRRAAQVAVINAQRAQVQQGLANIQAQASYNSSLAPSYDPVAQAQVSLSGAEQSASYIQAHAKDFNFSDILGALAAVNNARQAVADAIHQQQEQTIAANVQIAQAQDIGNVVSQAQDAIGGATQELQLARTPLEKAQAQAQLIQAYNDYNQAVITHVNNLTALSASLTNDPVQKALIQLQGAQKAARLAKGPDAKLQAAANVNNLKQQYEQTLVSQKESTIDFQLSMQKITTDQAISQLEGLLKLKDLTLQQRQEIQSKIRQLQQGDSQPGQFDLAPSGGANIKLPTPYDVKTAIRKIQQQVHARQLASAGLNPDGSPKADSGLDPGQRTTAPVHAATHRPTHRHELQQIANSNIGTIDARTYIAVSVSKGEHAAGVIDAIEKATGTRIKARLRAAGLRGT